MSSRNITFKELQEEMQRRAGEPGLPSRSSLPNLTSALNAFLNALSLPEDAAVGSALRISYYVRVAEHVARLHADGRSESYISNRKSLLKEWRRLVASLDRESSSRAVASCAEARTSPLAEVLNELLRSRTQSTAKRLGVPLATIRRWKAGAQVQQRSMRHLIKIERHFGMNPGALTDLAGGPIRKQMRQAQGRAHWDVPPARTIAYRELLARQHKLTYALKPDDASHTLREQWIALFSYKTDLFGLSSVLDEPSSGSGAKALSTRSYIWRLEAPDPHAKHDWSTSIGNRRCPSGQIVFGLVSQFIGWLRLSPAEGGCGRPDDEAQTLGHFANADLVKKFVEWRIARAGGNINGTPKRILMTVAMLTHPDHGFLPARGDIGASVGFSDPSAWKQRCAETHAWTKSARQRIAQRVQPSRDPFEPIREILALPNPLMAVADAIRRMDANRPLTCGKAEAVWARDRLLLALMASNPLRIKNIKRLTYNADNSGQLRQDTSGAWRIVIDKSEFKNVDGAAGDRDYSQLVQRQVWPFIDLFLRSYWRMLAPSESNYVFASKSDKKGVFERLNRRFDYLTKRYFGYGISFGPHAFRHIVATALIKKTGSFTAAALALHDREETVRAHYGHLTGDDAATFIAAGLGEAFDRM